MSEDENKPLIHAGTIPKKKYVMTADQKITMSQGKNEHQKQEKRLLDGRGHKQVPVIKDENATQQLPENYRCQFYCGTSTADGNCLYHACSMAVWGDESKSKEYRTDTAKELLSNPGGYCRDHPYIKSFIERNKIKNEDEIFSWYHVMFDESVKAITSEEELIKHIKNEGKETQNNGRYSSLLHVLALSTVLQRPIQSICPKVELYHGTIQPLPRKEKKVKQNKITLFWTGVPYDGASRVPIHIVPVFNKSERTISSALSVPNTSLHGSIVIQSSTPKKKQNRSSDTSPVTGDSGRKQPFSSDDSSAVNMPPFEQGIPQLKNNHQTKDPADNKITISQVKNEHQIEMEPLWPDVRSLSPVLVNKDENATQKLPDEYRCQFYWCQFFCGTSTEDGNCLYRACSLAIWGDESLSAKLRQYTADELLKNPTKYCTDHPYIKHIIKKNKLKNDEVFAMYHVMFHDNVKTITTEKELIERIRDEGKKTQNDGRYSSLLHVLALSTVLQRPIQSLYPEVQWIYRKLYHGTIQPLARELKEPKEITLFWTGESRVGAPLFPSHIVPVLRRQADYKITMSQVKNEHQIEMEPLLPNANNKITMSQVKNEHQIEMEPLWPDVRSLSPVLVKKDVNATQKLPDEYRCQFYCGTSTEDGNCLYRACSLAIWGDESLSAKLRQYTADELLKNPTEYCTDHPYINHIIKENKLKNDEVFAMYHVMFHDNVKPITSEEELIERIRDEGKKTQNDGRYSSLLHVLALSTVLQTPIQSIYPEVQWIYRKLYNGTIQPLAREPKEPKEITLFWTGEPRVGAPLFPSHIVPVLRKQDNRTTDSTIFKGCLTCQKKIPVYETKCLTKGCSNHVEPGYFKIYQGDHIEVPAEGCCGLFINHHAIVDSFECKNNGKGKIKVIDVPYKPDDSKLIIENHTLQKKDNIDLSTVKIIEYKRPLNDKKKTHKRAKQHISKDLVDETYHLFVRNCEHFASRCVNGNDPITIGKKFTHATSLQTVRCVVILFHAFCLLTMSAVYLVKVLVFIGFEGDNERLKKAFCFFESCYIGKNHGFTNTICDKGILAGYVVLLFVISCVISLYRCRCGLWIGDCECGCGRHRRMCFQCIWSSFLVMISKILCIAVMESKNFLLERFWLQIYQPSYFGRFIAILLSTVIIESLIVYFIISYYLAKILVWLFGKCTCGCIDEDSHDYCVRHGFI